MVLSQNFNYFSFLFPVQQFYPQVSFTIHKRFNIISNSKSWLTINLSTQLKSINQQIDLENKEVYQWESVTLK